MYSINEYYKFANNIYKSKGIKGIYNEGKNYIYESFLRLLSPLMDKEPEYVLDKEWDVLIILDACRVDLLEEVAQDYDFIKTPPHNTIWSADSYSEGWLVKNFTGKQLNKHKNKIRNLIHVSGNPFTNDVFNGDEFNILDEVWRYGWDNEQGYMPPSIITDKAIKHHRDEPNNQMIVHYMQPHAPFISENNTKYNIDIDEFANPDNKINNDTPWTLYRDSNLSRDELWSAYKDTLHVVLESVEKLINNIDADKVIISADHGNAIGEWGIYGHPRSIAISPLRNVPWVKTTAKNIDKYEPPEYNINSDELDRNEQLEALGYK